jgi:hypothetical protein
MLQTKHLKLFIAITLLDKGNKMVFTLIFFILTLFTVSCICLRIFHQRNRTLTYVNFDDHKKFEFGKFKLKDDYKEF